MFEKMAEQFVSIVAQKYPHDLELKIEALRFVVEGISHQSHSMEDQDKILFEFVTAIEEWIDKSGGYTNSVLDNHNKAYTILAETALECGDASKAVEYYNKLKDILSCVKNNAWSLMKIDVEIADAKSKMAGTDTVSFLCENIQVYQDFYKVTQETFGPVSSQALNSGDILAGALFDSKQFIQYERQIIALYEISRRLNGANHPYTLYCKDNLDDTQQRKAVLQTNKDQHLHVVKYDSTSDKYLVKDQGDHESCSAGFLVPVSDLHFFSGTPATCYGFQNEYKHLNGKLGELHDYDKTCNHYTMHFDNFAGQPIKIGPENIRIVFQLPP